MKQKTQMRQWMIQAMNKDITIIPDQTDQQEHTPMERLIDKINEKLCRYKKQWTMESITKVFLLTFLLKHPLSFWRNRIHLQFYMLGQKKDDCGMSRNISSHGRYWGESLSTQVAVDPCILRLVVRNGSAGGSPVPWMDRLPQLRAYRYIIITLRVCAEGI